MEERCGVTAAPLQQDDCGASLQASSQGWVITARATGHNALQVSKAESLYTEHGAIF